MPATTLYLVRHGEADDDDGTDPALTPRGRAQAAAVGSALRPTGAEVVLHGSRRRSIQSAQAIAAGIGAAGTEFSDLFEDRTPIPENWSDVPDRHHRFLRSVPDAEADPGARALVHAVRQLSQLEPSDRTIVAVTHNFVIGWFVRTVLDTPWWRWIGLDQANGAVTVIRWSHDREPVLLSFNERGHLPIAPADEIDSGTVDP